MVCIHKQVVLKIDNSVFNQFLDIFMIQNREKQFLTLTPHFKCEGGLDSHVAAAAYLLKDSGLSLATSSRISLELVEALGGCCDMLRIRRLIQLGSEALRAEEASVSFALAVEKCLEAKAHRSVRTVQDIRQTMNALMRCEAGLSERSVRGITSVEWSRILQKAYGHSPSRFVKARANLSGVYTVAYKQGWCAENPVKRIDVPELKERVIEPLPLDAVENLMCKAQHPVHRDCLPAVALMLYAGVRPDELRRLSWQDIDWDEGELYLAARHSKTGGGRHIPLCRPLLSLLKRERARGCNKAGAICPPRWKQRWQYLRQVAGFTQWVPDVLRHSYASYHAKMYRDLPRLQIAMGHRDCRLLLTRYINLRGISNKMAKLFWQAPWLKDFAKQVV